MIALLLSSPAAQAGSYSPPTMGGSGQWYSGYNQPTQSRPYSTSSSGLNGSAGTGDSSGQINSFGDITALYTWSTSTPANDPAPPCIVMQSCRTSWYGTYASPPASSCSDGFGDGEIKSSNGQNYQGNCNGTRYSVVTPDTSGSFTLTLSGAQSHTPVSTLSGFYYSTVSYSCTAYPVTVTLAGQNPANQALTGQQITASLSTPNGLPTGAKITSYTWSFDSGVVDKPAKPIKKRDETASGDPTHPQLVPLTDADLTATDKSGNGISVSPVSFYDEVQENVTVKCAVSLKFADGTTATVNAQSVPVAFLKPTANWMFTQTTVADQPDKGSFQAGELLGPISITVPSPFSGGSGCLAQLGTFDRSVKRHPLNNQPDTYSCKVQKTNPDGTTSWIVPGQGLDGGFPYTQSITLDSNNNPVVTDHNGGYTWGADDQGTPADTPTQSYTNKSLDSGGNDWYQAHASDSFVDYLMYKPPPFGNQGVIWVPLKTLTWSWNATATKDATGEWKSMGGMTTGQVTDATSPPQWSTVLQAAEQHHP